MSIDMENGTVCTGRELLTAQHTHTIHVEW